MLNTGTLKVTTPSEREVLYESQEIRDIVAASGMEHGAAETYDRLADLLPSLA